MNWHRGFILIVVLALLGLITTVGLLFINSAKQFKSLSRTYFDQVRVKALALSGYEKAINQHISDLTFKRFDEQSILGEGTYAQNGDVVDLKTSDFNGKININQGDLANNTLGGLSSESGAANYPVRQLLNAYGEVHRFVDHVFDDVIVNASNPEYYKRDLPAPNPYTVVSTYQYEDFYDRPSPVFSSDAFRDWPNLRGLQSDEDFLDNNTGLGDHLIHLRPVGGYQSVEEVADTVNQWASHVNVNLSSQYLKDTTFFNLVNGDLTVKSYQDEFYSLQTWSDEERYGYFGKTGGEAHGDFRPKSMHVTSDNSFIPSEIDTKRMIPLINLNAASTFVKAAVFYAPTNVSYSVDGATSIPPYLFGSGSSEYLRNPFIESMIALPNRGIRPPVFHPDRYRRENGLDDVGIETHLMSLRDALHLANAYEKYTDPSQGQDPVASINNFDDFRDFLIDHETSGILEGNIPAYERVHSLSELPYASDPLDGVDFNAGGLYHVSTYEQRGIFGQDYVAKTLPHILSCIRRLPGHYGAPLALQSPYIMRKPDYDSNLYKQGLLCRQGFLKIEDFVLRLPYPKVCFLSCGTLSISSTGILIDNQRQVVASNKLTATAEVFETRYIRSQQDFQTITYKNQVDLNDPFDTDQSIKIGPEHSLEGGRYEEVFGFVGLDDYFDDPLEDPFMNQDGQGYSPHLVMNFTFDESDPDDLLTGFENISEEVISPIIADFQNSDDTWVDDSSLSDFYEKTFFIEPRNGLNTLGLSDLSPFNGYYRIQEGSEFSDLTRHALYWRLSDYSEPGGDDGGNDDAQIVDGGGGSGGPRGDPGGDGGGGEQADEQLPGWLESDKPIGESLSRGIMTFWFRLPSDYDYPTMVTTSPGVDIEPVSFTRVLAHLHFWEKYQFNPLFEEVTRPVSITVGLKKTPTRGLHVFARYDTGGEHHDGSVTNAYVGLSPYDDEAALQASVFNALLGNQYDYCGFNTSFDNNYLDYRKIAHRSVQASAKFKSSAECGPGSWHRVSVYWNLGWVDGGRSLEEQLNIDIHDASNKDGETVFKQEVTYADSDYKGDGHFAYPTDPGLTQPFYPSMILSLGEAHALRLGSYSILYYESNTYTKAGYGDPLVSLNNPGFVYNAWPCHTGIDNFRLYMGPQTPLYDEQVSDHYFQQDFVSRTVASNLHGALRYEVTHVNHGFDKTLEPIWAIDLNQEEMRLAPGSRLLQVGTRVYYPPDSSDPANTPYVYLSSGNDVGGVPQIFKPLKVSKNEQDLFYDKKRTNSDFKIRLQYKAFKPVLDGDQSNQEDEPLVYAGTDHVTQIPWIKEINTRHIPAQGIKIISWEWEKISY